MRKDINRKYEWEGITVERVEDADRSHAPIVLSPQPHLHVLLE